MRSKEITWQSRIVGVLIGLTIQGLVLGQPTLTYAAGLTLLLAGIHLAVLVSRVREGGSHV